MRLSILLVLLFASAAQADLIGVVRTETGNNQAAIDWLSNLRGESDLVSLVKQDETVTGIYSDGWQLQQSLESRYNAWSIDSLTSPPAAYVVVKFDGLAAVYETLGRSTGSYNLDTDVYTGGRQAGTLFVDIVDASGNVLVSAGSYTNGWSSSLTPWAAVSNVEVFGSAIPEPSSAILLMLSSAGLVLTRYRRS